VEYSIKKLSQMAGVSARTLRYYDEIGLLMPKRTSSNGYRVYGRREVDLLQQILFFREMGLPLDEIKRIVLSEDFDGEAALENHLASLLAKEEQIQRLIANVERSISAMKGVETMKDEEKFEGFKEKLIVENEEKYGAEIRGKYGEDTVEASNRKFKGMSREQYAEAERLFAKLNEELKAAFLQGDPSGEAAQRVCAIHREWLGYFWDSYSKEAHIGLTQMYVEDERFTAYYDKIAEGCAVFLRDAIQIYCQ